MDPQSQSQLQSPALPSTGLREPLPISEPSAAFVTPRYIQFRHPGYPSPDQIDVPILRLPAYDGNGQGVHHGTAFTACAIVANNSFDGYLTESLDGDRVSAGFDEILSGPVYWFYADSRPDASKRYPIVPSFHHWSFPHAFFGNEAQLATSTETAGTILARWSRQDSSTSTTSRYLPLDTKAKAISSLGLLHPKCQLSGSSHVCQGAHIIPGHCTLWWRRNQMLGYLMNVNRGLGIDHPRNLLYLRVDLHQVFDDAHFAFVPERNGEFVPRFLSYRHPQLASEMHNRRLHDSSLMDGKLLFARFAWTIFPLLGEFLQGRSARELILVNEATEMSEQKCVAARSCPGYITKNPRSGGKRTYSEMTPTTVPTSEAYSELRDDDLGEDENENENENEDDDDDEDEEHARKLRLRRFFQSLLAKQQQEPNEAEPSPEYSLEESVL